MQVPWRRSFSHGFRYGLGIVLGQFGQRLLEVLGLAEIAIDRSEADVGHVVERAEILHHGFADGLRGDLTLTNAFQIADDFRHQLLHLLRLDGPLAQRDRQRAKELVAIEGNAASVALEDHKFAELHALEGREAEVAGQTDTAATDRGRVFRRP